MRKEERERERDGDGVPRGERRVEEGMGARLPQH